MSGGGQQSATCQPACQSASPTKYHQPCSTQSLLQRKTRRLVDGASTWTSQLTSKRILGASYTINGYEPWCHLLLLAQYLNPACLAVLAHFVLPAVLRQPFTIFSCLHGGVDKLSTLELCRGRLFPRWWTASSALRGPTGNKRQ